MVKCYYPLVTLVTPSSNLIRTETKTVIISVIPNDAAANAQTVCLCEYFAI